MYKYITLALLFCVATIWGCKKEQSLGEMQVQAVQVLSLPANNVHVDIEPKAGKTDFIWEASATQDNHVTLYELVFDKLGGDFSKPLFVYASEGNGMNPRLTIAHTLLNKIATAAGIESLSTGKLIWTVRASKGLSMLQSPVIHTLELTRPEGFSDIPLELYLTGTASEGGNDLSKGLKFAKQPDDKDVFEIYTKLSAGTYHFADNKTGTAKSYSANGNGLVAEGETTVAADAGVYRIRVNFSSATVEFTKIISAGIFLSGDNKVIFGLPYVANGTFTALNAAVSFKQEGWGRDERYKIRMEVIKPDGAAGTEWLGSTNRDNSPPVAASAPSYYYVFKVDNSQYDYSFKFIKEADNKNVDVSLKLNAESAYTHSVTVK